MANLELDKYVQNARAQGASDENIKSQLVKGGWPEDEVSEALSPRPAGGVNLPPPPVPRFGMWVSFEHIIFFIALYIDATALGGILFNAVDHVFPDKLSQNYYYYDYQSTLLHGYIAALIVGFPIFAVLYVLLRRQILKNQGVRNIRSRKLLIYLTLVVTFVIMVTDLITDVYAYLEGTETLRSMGHSVVILVIAGAIFVWLISEVREDRKSR